MQMHGDCDGYIACYATTETKNTLHPSGYYTKKLVMYHTVRINLVFLLSLCIRDCEDAPLVGVRTDGPLLEHGNCSVTFSQLLSENVNQRIKF